MFSKSLMQFSVDGWSCVTSLLFTWGQTMVEVMKIMATSFKRSHVCTAVLSGQLCIDLGKVLLCRIKLLSFPVA